MSATSSDPVGFLWPPPIRPMDFDGRSRNADNRSTHCSSNWRRCTRTRVLTPRWAISHAAITVFPNAVVADRTPVSWASIARAAISDAQVISIAKGIADEATARSLAARTAARFSYRGFAVEVAFG